MGIVDRLRRIGERVPVSCPDGIKGCLVYHYRIETDPVCEQAADFITRLRGYAAHSDECAINAWMPRGDEPCPSCSCGLSALLEEIDHD